MIYKWWEKKSWQTKKNQAREPLSAYIMQSHTECVRSKSCANENVKCFGQNGMKHYFSPYIQSSCKNWGQTKKMETKITQNKATRWKYTFEICLSFGRTFPFPLQYLKLGNCFVDRWPLCYTQLNTSNFRRRSIMSESEFIDRQPKMKNTPICL